MRSWARPRCRCPPGRDCRRGRRWAGGGRRCRTISRAGVQSGVVVSSPDDHFTGGPHCRVKLTASRHVDGAGRCPRISSGIVSPAGVQIGVASSAPYDHFTATPHCRVKLSCGGRVASARSYPSIGAWIVSPAGVENGVANSTPDDHFGAGPHSRVKRITKGSFPSASNSSRATSGCRVCFAM